GKTIGSFQVWHQYVADMAMMQTQAELLTYYAAWKSDQGDDCGREANMAKVTASE
ncbi:uncharacterized protein METZ01_LOCUS370471, partial [marine metagenome]